MYREAIASTTRATRIVQWDDWTFMVSVDLRFAMPLHEFSQNGRGSLSSPRLSTIDGEDQAETLFKLFHSRRAGESSTSTRVGICKMTTRYTLREDRVLEELRRHLA